MPTLVDPHAILIDLIHPKTEKQQAERRLHELSLLTQTYGGIVIIQLIQKRSLPDYRTFIGPGKLQEILEIAQVKKANLLIVNNALKPKQIFEMEEFFRKHKYKIHVWDRLDLILKIFSKHAKTSEAKLQIKLAAIRHMGPRIFGMGMELMQQTGGIGTRGLGETNTEIMRRHLAEQEEQTEKQLKRVSATRLLHRRERDRKGMRTVSVVGYTNAGKSSLVQALTSKNVFVANKLFATLDTRIGRLKTPTQDTPLLISDTIGFIQDLPPQLISAFRSTLDETVEADLILHVIDVTDPHLKQKIQEVEDILHQLKVSHTPKIYVFNKIDALPKPPSPDLSDQYAEFHPVFVSALTGQGIEKLKHALVEQTSKS